MYHFWGTSPMTTSGVEVIFTYRIRTNFPEFGDYKIASYTFAFLSRKYSLHVFSTATHLTRSNHSKGQSFCLVTIRKMFEKVRSNYTSQNLIQKNFIEIFELHLELLEQNMGISRSIFEYNIHKRIYPNFKFSNQFRQVSDFEFQISRNSSFKLHCGIALMKRCTLISAISKVLYIFFNRFDFKLNKILLRSKISYSLIQFRVIFLQNKFL